eukprot:COSAG02_NODE_539_length_20605_cov_93.802155_8_plen_190_part_00
MVFVMVFVTVARAKKRNLRHFCLVMLDLRAALGPAHLGNSSHRLNRLGGAVQAGKTTGGLLISLCFYRLKPKPVPVLQKSDSRLGNETFQSTPSDTIVSAVKLMSWFIRSRASNCEGEGGGWRQASEGAEKGWKRAGKRRRVPKRMEERGGGVAEGEGSRGGRGRVGAGRLRPPRDSVFKTESRGVCTN